MSRQAARRACALPLRGAVSFSQAAGAETTPVPRLPRPRANLAANRFADAPPPKGTPFMPGRHSIPGASARTFIEVLTNVPLEPHMPKSEATLRVVEALQQD